MWYWYDPKMSKKHVTLNIVCIDNLLHLKAVPTNADISQRPKTTIETILTVCSRNVTRYESGRLRTVWTILLSCIVGLTLIIYTNKKSENIGKRNGRRRSRNISFYIKRDNYHIEI